MSNAAKESTSGARCAAAGKFSAARVRAKATIGLRENWSGPERSIKLVSTASSRAVNIATNLAFRSCGNPTPGPRELDKTEIPKHFFRSLRKA